MGDQSNIFLDIIFGPESISFYREFNKDPDNPTAESKFDMEEVEKDTSRKDNIRIELKIAQVFHKVLNMIKVDPGLFQKGDFELLGEMLFKILFGKDSKDPRHREIVYIMREMMNNPDMRCRIYLRSLNDKVMISLPWEYTRFKYEDFITHEPKPFYLAANTDNKFQLIRKFGSVKYKKEPTSNLKLILIICNKGNRNPENGPEIKGLVKERENVIGLFENLKNDPTGKTNKFTYEMIENPEFSELEKLVSEKIQKLSNGNPEPFCIHYFGHSFFDGEHGKIVFMKNNNAEWIDDTQLALLFNPENKRAIKPEMIAFQSCDSGKIGIDKNSIAGLPVYPLQYNIPAVVAMQNEINPDVSSVFFEKFYQNIMDGADVAEAVTLGRDYLGREMSKPEVYKNNYFGSPVLFISTDEPIQLLKRKVADDGAGKMISCAWCNKQIYEKEAPGDANFCPICGIRNPKLKSETSGSESSEKASDDSNISKGAISVRSGSSSNEREKLDKGLLQSTEDAKIKSPDEIKPINAPR